MVGIKSVFQISAVLSLVVIGITGCSYVTSTASDIAETLVSDIAETDASDIADTEGSDIAEEGASDIADTGESGIAEAEASDFVETDAFNSAETDSGRAQKTAEQEAYPSAENDSAAENDCTAIEDIAAIYRDTYNNCDKAAGAGPLNSIEILQHIVSRLGEMGYVAVDSGNQVNMEGAEQAEDFCRAVEAEKSACLTVIVVMISGFQKFDLQTTEGSVTVTRAYYQYGSDGAFRNRSTVSYPASWWEYTEEGYLIFEGSYLTEENYVLTCSETREHTALRVLPLDEKGREWNRKYILPVGYGQNNLFLTDWSEDDFGETDFYDLFDILYPLLYGQPIPYTADGNAGFGTTWQVPENVFENVIRTYFRIDRETLRLKTTYIPETASYLYRPRGFYETESPDIPWPEVVSCTENQDGTIELTVNAVYPNGNTSRAYTHRTVIRPQDDGTFQYVSNRMLSPEEDCDIRWHSERMTEEEWREAYGDAD